MAKTNEKITGIIAEMRFHGQQNIDAEKDKPKYGILTVEGRIIQNYADRLEAAHKREKSAIEADALAVGGMVEAAHKREKSKIVSKNGADFGQLGDLAKLREALSDACYAMFNFLKTQYGGYEEMANALDKAKAALAAPPRNCDRFDSFPQAYDEWFKTEVLPRVHGVVDGADLPFDSWLFLPAVEKKGEKNENK